MELSAGSELVLFSPDAVEGFSVCQHHCMRVTPDSLPASGKVTTPPIAGAEMRSGCSHSLSTTSGGPLYSKFCLPGVLSRGSDHPALLSATGTGWCIHIHSTSAQRDAGAELYTLTLRPILPSTIAAKLEQ